MRRHAKSVTRLLAHPAPVLRWATLTALIVLFTTCSGPSEAQTPNRTYRLGHLAISAESVVRTRRVMLPELAKRGFTEGRNLIFDARTGSPDELPTLARELLATLPDAIVAICGDAILSARGVPRTVPIVSHGSDPIAMGFAESLARPRRQRHGRKDFICRTRRQAAGPAARSGGRGAVRSGSFPDGNDGSSGSVGTRDGHGGGEGRD